MVQFDVAPVVRLGNDWIAIGDALYERARTMDGAINAVGWTGAAGTAARAAWHDGDRGVFSSLSTSADAAWKIGESLHVYAEELQKTIHEINKQRLVAALANIFGLALGGLLLELGPLIGALLTAVRNILANMVPWFARLAAALAKTGAVGTFVSNAVVGAAMNLGLDVVTQLMADAAAGEKFHGVDWQDEAISIVLGAQESAVGDHWTPHPKRSVSATESSPVPKLTPTGSAAPTNTPKQSVVLPVTETKVPLPDFLSKALTLPPYGPTRSSTGAKIQGGPTQLDPAHAPTATSATPTETGPSASAPTTPGAAPRPPESARPTEAPPTAPPSTAAPAQPAPTHTSATTGPTSTTPGATAPGATAPDGPPSKSFPGKGNTLDAPPGARTNPSDNQPTTVNIPPVGSKAAPPNTPFPGTGNTLDAAPGARTNPSDQQPTTVNIPPTGGKTTEPGNPFPGKGNTLGAAPGSRINPSDQQPTTVNIPTVGGNTTTPAPSLPPRRTGPGYDHPADLSTLTNKPDTLFPGTGNTLDAPPGARTNPSDQQPTTVNIPPTTSKAAKSDPFPGTGNTLGAPPRPRISPSDNQPTTVNIPPIGAGSSPGRGVPPRTDVGYRRPATLDDIGAHASGDAGGGSRPGGSGSGNGTTMNQGSGTVTQVIHEEPRPSPHESPQSGAAPAAVTASRGESDTNSGSAPGRSSGATTVPEPGGETGHGPGGETGPEPGGGTGHRPDADLTPSAAAPPKADAAPSTTRPATTPQPDRLDIDAARATIGDAALPPDTLARATTQAAAILSVRWHQVQPNADPAGAAPLVPRPRNGPIGTGYTRALDLVTAQVVRHGPLTGQATAASALPGAAGRGEGPLLLFAEPGPEGDALHLGAHHVPLADLPNWLPAHTGWSPGDLVVLPTPGAAASGPHGGPSLAQRIADHTGAPVLAPDGALHVNGDGRLVTDGPQGWVESLPHQAPVVRSPELGQSLFAHAARPTEVHGSAQVAAPAGAESGASAPHQVVLADLLPAGALDIDLTPELAGALAETAVQAVRTQLGVPTGPLGHEIRFTAPTDGAQLAKVLEVTQHVAGTLGQSVPVVRDTDGRLLVKICPPG
ncbi:hypothetical protein ACIBL6_22740 [Streptomyces sp. NPDC050400]|uniref:hypothetical protein n=1 Tax=Streptomyces sp. NPDC050400 TaxID=3365610 RepID=UPI00379AF176